MKGYRTVLFNIAAAILPILEMSGQDLGLTGQTLAIYTLLVTGGNLLLRKFTTTPVGKKTS